MSTKTNQWAGINGKSKIGLKHSLVDSEAEFYFEIFKFS